MSEEYCGGCGKDSCSSCRNLECYAPNFLVNGVTCTECESLFKDQGLNPNLDVLHDNCEDINDIRNCYVGQTIESLPAFDVCEWKDFMGDFLPKLNQLLKAMGCGDCGQWFRIHELEKYVYEDGYAPVFLNYEYTVPVDKFIRISGSGEKGLWFSGAPEKQESFITIPLGKMDIVDGVFAQPQVVGDKTHPVTVAIQENYQEGNNFIVNFDTYIFEGIQLSGHPETNAPFAVPIEFFVMGRKKIPWWDELDG